MIPKSFSQEQLSWIGWCFLEGRGGTTDGLQLDSFKQVFEYTAKMVETGNHPPHLQDQQQAMDLVSGVFSILYLATAAGVEPGNELWFAPDADVSRALHWQDHPQPPEIIESIQEFLFYLVHNDLYRFAEEFINPLKQVIPFLSDEKQLIFTMNLSAIVREQISIQESMEYLETVKSLVPKAPPSTQVSYYHALGNAAKDMGDYQLALSHYQKAEEIAQESAPEVIGAVYFQLGRFYSEQGKELSLAIRYLDKAKEAGFAKLPHSFPLLSEITRIQVLISQGEYLATHKMLSEILTGLIDPPYFHEEAVIHSLLATLAKFYGLGIEVEWSMRMATIAGVLGKKTRELGGMYSNLAMILTALLQGSEARYWFVKSLQQSEKTQETIYKPELFCSIAFAEYIFGMLAESVQHFEQGIAESKKQGKLDMLIHNLAQLSLASLSFSPERSASAKEEIEQLTREYSISPSSNQQLAYLAAREILSASPNVLLKWPDILRRSKHRLEGELYTLQMILDVHGEKDLPAGSMLPPPVLWKRGVAFGYLCGRGYLSFLFHYCAVSPREVLEWVLVSPTHTELRDRICLEWIVNPGGQKQECRRGETGDKTPWKQVFPQLRASMMRYFFQSDLCNYTEGKEKNQERLPHGPDATELSSSYNEMISLYTAWRREMVFKLDVLDPEKNARPRKATRQISPMSDLMQHIDYEKLQGLNAQRIMKEITDNPSEVLEKMMELWKEVKIPDHLQPRDIGFPTAMELGIRLDNFLDIELYEPLQELMQNWSGDRPIIADFFQGKSTGFWILVDLNIEPYRDAVSVYPVHMSHKDAEVLVKKIQDLLESQEKSKKRMDVSFLFQECTSLFEALYRKVSSGREIWLNVMAPWAVIPFEQLPIAQDGRAMVDHYSVIRRDRFNHWLYQPKTPIETTKSDAAVFGDPLKNLPSATEEAQTVATLLGIEPLVGENCTVEHFKQMVVGKSIVHLACHGYHFTKLGDFQALGFADKYLIGQELGALDLQDCRLFVLSACYSDAGELYGTSPIESLAGYLLEAGVQTILASKSAVSDKRAASAMQVFYQELLRGDTVAKAATIAFGINQRMKQGIVMCPWILLGRNAPIFKR